MNRRTLGWLLVVVQFTLLGILVLLPWRAPSLWSMAVGVPLFAAGVVLGLSASRRLGSALTPTPVPIAEAGLRTTGVYARVRHPIYSAVLLMVLGFVIAVGSPWSWGCALLILLFLWLKSRWEDGLLRETYGQEWVQWAALTGALVPRMTRARPGDQSGSSSTTP